ncbi:MJ0570-related uncharacterized domain-containing protein [Fodinibius salinus]|uniref:MJ0570-related uncharacterized domain-containing protein n=1 Tax=Fodinibius salinus TaxID=860790 RepID=A0A5D3YP72_9BACT|nr:hypothetical protein [Fodinibius salinus]TYP94833.1 MJ0570-related uncharacterized domain-containing protein [Fodinibius salinus]
MDILFWSGGKDAYLALQFYRDMHPDSTIQLLTTFDETNQVVPHQQIRLSHIKKQADHLGVDLITVALPPKCSNDIYLSRLQEEFNTLESEIRNLVFGDWYLQDIRDWREEVFGQMGLNCQFPIWKEDIHELLPILFLNPIKIEISAVRENLRHLISVGEIYNQGFITQLQHLSENIDPMGENGEFHTKVIFQNPD